MGAIVWVIRQGIEPSFTYRAKVERIAPRRGRTLSIEGPIRNVHLPRRQTFGVPERSAFDHRGHLIASRFGGPNARVNLVAMHGIVNMVKGPWYKMEQEIAEMLHGNVERTGMMKVVVHYHPGELLRPVAFFAEARDHRGYFQTWRIPNTNPYLANPLAQRAVEQLAASVANDAGMN